MDRFLNFLILKKVVKIVINFIYFISFVSFLINLTENCCQIFGVFCRKFVKFVFNKNPFKMSDIKFAFKLAKITGDVEQDKDEPDAEKIEEKFEENEDKRNEPDEEEFEEDEEHKEFRAKMQAKLELEIFGPDIDDDSPGSSLTNSDERLDNLVELDKTLVKQRYKFTSEYLEVGAYGKVIKVIVLLPLPAYNCLLIICHF